MSGCAPSRSDLTQSSFLKSLYGIQDDAVPDCDLESHRDDLISQLEGLRDETQGSLDNMPEGLQQGDTGQLLQQRIENLEQGIDSLQNIYFEEYKAALEAMKTELQEALDGIDAA